ncbi:MAG TPA: hypothetical protein VGQ20_09085 [Acidimicrobiales bacterium]|nr:hypothetical protein [Acidimicrobiales bacterium]
MRRDAIDEQPAGSVNVFRREGDYWSVIFDGHTVRVRVGVTRAVRQAIARIAEHHPQLGEHLNRTIRTGAYRSYLPDPRAPTAWGS